MRVDDLDDGNLLQTGNALLGLVVVDEDYAERRLLRKGPLEKRADETPLLVDDGDVVVRILQDLRAVVQRGLADGQGEVGFRDEERQELRRREHARERSVARPHGKRRFAARLKDLQRIHK